MSWLRNTIVDRVRYMILKNSDYSECHENESYSDEDELCYYTGSTSR